MEFKNSIFQTWLVMDFNCRFLKVMENLSFVWWISHWEMIEQHKRHAFRSPPEFVSVELFKIQKYPKTHKL